MTHSFRRTSLPSILALDSATCAAMGVLLIAASGPVSSITQIPAPLLFWAGLLLLPIAGFMAFLVRRPIIPPLALQVVVLGNVLWVVGSVALPVLGLISPNLFGWLFLLAQAGIVALFVVFEWSALQHPVDVA